MMRLLPRQFVFIHILQAGRRADIEAAQLLTLGHTFDCDSDPLGWQLLTDDITPFDDNDGVRILRDLSQFMADHASFVQAVEIKMVQIKFVPAFVDPADREGRAAHVVFAAKPFSQAFGKCRLAAAQVRYQDKDFAASTLFPEALAYFVSIVVAGRFD